MSEMYLNKGQPDISLNMDESKELFCCKPYTSMVFNTKFIVRFSPHAG